MSQRKTHEEFVQEIESLVGDEYTVLSPYVNNKTKVLMRHNCKNCNNYEWEVRPDKFLQGRRCPFCSQRIHKTTEMFKQEVFELEGDNYVVLGEYINKNTKVKMLHKGCGREFYTWPYEFINRGRRCSLCRLDSLGKSNEQFLEEVEALVGDEYIFLDEYQHSTNIKLRVKHNVCGHVYMTRPCTFLAGYRCPRCKESKGEKAISNYLETQGIEYIPQYIIEECKNRNYLPFDFAVLDNDGNLQFLIEYQGKQHYEYVDFFFRNEENFVNRVLTDCTKQAYCEYEHIPLLTISYKDYENIEKILEEYLEKYFEGGDAIL